MQAKNSASSLVNSLPPEVLAHIFTFSKTAYCIHEAGFGLDSDSFALTCVHWRQVALSTPRLWSHIDVGPRIPVGLGRLLLRRTRDAPVHVHVYEPNPGLAFLQLNSNPGARITNLLRPHIHRVRTLHINSTSLSKSMADNLMDLSTECGRTGLPMTLIAKRPRAKYHDTALPSYSAPLEELQGTLRPIRTLHLLNVAFDWMGGAFHDLVDLRLQFNQVTNPLPLIDVLAASPLIQVLKLERADIADPTGSIQLAPTFLPRLNTLTLHGVPTTGLQRILSVLSLSAPSAQVSLLIPDLDSIKRQLEAFFVRSRIATLHCYCADSAFTYWPPLLGLYPYFRTLVLRRMNLRELNLDDSDSFISISRPYTIILLECDIYVSGLEALAARHGVSDLRLEMCRSLYDSGERMFVPSDDLEARLQTKRPDLKCSISNVDSTSGLACRTMFDA